MFTKNCDIKKVILILLYSLIFSTTQAKDAIQQKIILDQPTLIQPTPKQPEQKIQHAIDTPQQNPILEQPTLIQPTPKQPEQKIQRTILSLYLGDQNNEIQYHPIHITFDMPLNHLGLRVKHWNLAKGFPEHIDMEEIRGILIHFDANELADPTSFLDWIMPHMKNGKKIVLLGAIGFFQNKKEIETPAHLINSFFNYLGLQLGIKNSNETYNVKYDPYDPARIEFEHKLSSNLEPYISLTKLTSRVDVILSATTPNQTSSSILVCTNENGGYAASGYNRFETSKGITQWRINPFDFFRKAFATDEIIKPDTTTLFGNRIFYAHIDGDGWRSISQTPKYAEKQYNCTQVIEEEIIKKYPHLPLTIAPIVADLDPTYFGTPALIEQAKNIFLYPHISAGSHSYTHPLDWKFYDVPDADAKEKKLFGASLNQVEYQHNRKEVVKKIGNGYSLPRSYLFGEFQIEKELMGSINFIKKIIPSNKKISLFQWSGDCVAFEGALQILKKNGIYNINGGYTRFDPEFPSYAFVGPIGRDEGNEWQIYASSNNENTYTDNWTNKFFGYRYLTNTFERTETPYRVKPFNLYYHMYSAEKTSSLKALKDNYDYIDKQKKISITAKQFSKIANGFFSTELQKLGDKKWLVLNRGNANTFRFDYATLLEIDWVQSKGVIGYNHLQGSLYVSLDKNIKEPIIALKEPDIIPTSPQLTPHPYIHKSTWIISNFEPKDDNSINLKVHGYGEGKIKLFCPKQGTYSLQGKAINGKNFTYNGTQNKQGIVSFDIPENAIDSLQLYISFTQ
ncbi:MAG: hypothetical protein Q8L85_03440 [Alphaproteobacteria bacterium]|nr:hypothetical protein [Alphaproteobacteria bacterium]